MTDDLYPPIHFASGHRCEHNGVGDYTLVCPLRGPKPGFIPYLIAHTLIPTQRCPLCLQQLGAMVALG